MLCLKAMTKLMPERMHCVLSVLCHRIKWRHKINLHRAMPQ